MKVKSESEVAQSCPILSDPMDWSLPDSSMHGILQARVLEWGAIDFSIALTRQTFVGKVMSLLLNIATDNSQVIMVTGYLKESGDHSLSYIFPPFLLRCHLVYQLLLHLQCLQRREKHSSPANALKETVCVRKPIAIVY